MSGESDLATLLSTMEPFQRPGDYVVVSVPDFAEIDWSGVDVEAMVREEEGTSVVVARSTADERGWTYDFVAAWVTLRVHSDLAAVGLTAALSAALAARGIPANVLAGYFHDHVLVPVDRAREAVAVLESLARRQD